MTLFICKMIKLGSERCYFPDILKIGTEKGTSHQKRKKKQQIKSKTNQNTYWSRTNYRHFFLVFVSLFLCSPIHPFKRLIHNFECYQSTYLGRKYKYSLCTCSYQRAYVKLLFLSLNREGRVPIFAILLNV